LEKRRKGLEAGTATSWAAVANARVAKLATSRWCRARDVRAHILPHDLRGKLQPKAGPDSDNTSMVPLGRVILPPSGQYVQVAPFKEDGCLAARLYGHGLYKSHRDAATW
jgi:hypothetical protein